TGPLGVLSSNAPPSGTRERVIKDVLATGRINRDYRKLSLLLPVEIAERLFEPCLRCAVHDTGIIVDISRRLRKWRLRRLGESETHSHEQQPESGKHT